MEFRCISGSGRNVCKKECSSAWHYIAVYSIYCESGLCDYVQSKKTSRMFFPSEHFSFTAQASSTGIKLWECLQSVTEKCVIVAVYLCSECAVGGLHQYVVMTDAVVSCVISASYNWQRMKAAAWEVYEGITYSRGLYSVFFLPWMLPICSQGNRADMYCVITCTHRLIMRQA